MNAKQKLTLGIAAIFMVTLTIVGVTYAYFVTQVTGTDTVDNVKIQTAKIGVEYGDGNNIVTLTDILPGQVVYKSFTVTNSMSDVAVKYDIGVTPTSGATQFIHSANLADASNCYAETPTNTDTCYSGTKFNNIYVSVVEVPTGSTVDYDQTAETEANFTTYQNSLATLFNTGTSVQASTNVITTGTQLFPTQTIDALNGAASVVKKYVLKIEYREIESNQNIENNANLSLKVDLYIPQGA